MLTASEYIVKTFKFVRHWPFLNWYFKLKNSNKKSLYSTIIYDTDLYKLSDMRTKSTSTML